MYIIQSGSQARRLERSVVSRKEPIMRYRTHPVTDETAADPYSGSSLVPMLVAGLVLTLIGMIVAVLVT
jgi:hypothetical protein